MLYTVQVRLDGDIAGRMAEMRQWLDRGGIEPDLFQYRRMDADGVLCRVDFKVKDEAATFAEAFAGAVVG